MTTEQWERENQDTLMEYFIDGDPSVRRIQCEYCRKVIYTQTRNRKYCSFQTCGHKMLNLRKSLKKRAERGTYTCACCGKQFLPIRADARYCSNACRQKDYRQRKANAASILQSGASHFENFGFTCNTVRPLRKNQLAKMTT